VVRGALEAAALEAAVRQSTPADHARAAAVHAAHDEAVAASDPAAFQRASRDFHEALLAPCRMPRLLHMLDIAWNVTEPVQTMMRVSSQEREEMAADHEEMLAAFEARDAERLKAAAQAHHARLTACITRLSGE
jgi:DNA-binding GntR family transcriptional regulator